MSSPWRTRLISAPFLLYRAVIAPLFGVKTCRYHPTCSEYARQALVKHGLIKGLWLSTKRLGRCHPWGGQGDDPVP